MTIETSSLAEGRNTFRASAHDPAGNTGHSPAWSVVVDRSAPTMPRDIELLTADEEEATLDVGWTRGEDPVLPDGSPGAGMAYTWLRHRREYEGWSEWQRVDGDSAEIPGARAGEVVWVEMTSVDAVGNASPAAAMPLLVESEVPVGDADGDTNDEDELDDRDISGENVAVAG